MADVTAFLARNMPAGYASITALRCQVNAPFSYLFATTQNFIVIGQTGQGKTSVLPAFYTEAESRSRVMTYGQHSLEIHNDK